MISLSCVSSANFGAALAFYISEAGAIASVAPVKMLLIAAIERKPIMMRNRPMLRYQSRGESSNSVSRREPIINHHLVLNK